MNQNNYGLTSVAKMASETVEVREKVQTVLTELKEIQNRLRKVKLDISALRGQVCGIELDVQEAIEKAQRIYKRIPNTEVDEVTEALSTNVTLANMPGKLERRSS